MAFNNAITTHMGNYGHSSQSNWTGAQKQQNKQGSQMALCRAVVVFVLYFRCLNEFYFMLTKVQLLWLLHSSSPSPEYYTYNSFQV